MRVHSIKQPWAYLIMKGLIDTHKCKWKPKDSPPFPLIIHGNKIDMEGMAYMERNKIAHPLFFLHNRLLGIIQLEKITTGVMVFKDPERFIEPYKCTGQPGFWNLPEELERIVHNEIYL